ncbi:MAG: hypothetical protein RLZZ592_521 [Pseudomonadota bacterium]|jgi:hypothetical protein
MCFRLLLSLLLLVSNGVVHAAPPEPQGTVAVTKTGQLVVDVESGLVWSRCVEGLRWNGRACIGTPRRVTQAQALELAAARRRADGLPWRVPRAIEVRRVLRRGLESPGGLARLFPDTPEGWLWSASATIETGLGGHPAHDGSNSGPEERLDGLHAWVIDGHTGQARSDMSRDTLLPVRLVHARD